MREERYRQVDVGAVVRVEPVLKSRMIGALLNAVGSDVVVSLADHARVVLRGASPIVPLLRTLVVEKEVPIRALAGRWPLMKERAVVRLLCVNGLAVVEPLLYEPGLR
jgi:hypothetical protein